MQGGLQFSVSQSCGDQLLITPIGRQIDNTWMDLSNNETVSLNADMWDVGQPNGEELQECALFNVITGKFFDDSCTVKYCFLCSWRYKPKFTLKGLCSDSEVDHQYVLLPERTYDEQFIFSGYERNYIIFNKELGSWLIIGDEFVPSDGVMPEIVLGNFSPDAFSNQLPVGKKNWQLTEQGCNGTLPLKLTHVSKTLYYFKFVTLLNSLGLQVDF